MPSRLLREGILTSERLEKPCREWIPTSIQREIKAQPCVICGVPYAIHCDHIVPVVRGGKSVRSNLQPLCRDCNYAKKHLRTNDDVALVIAGRGYEHFAEAVYRQATRGLNPYDRIRRWDFFATSTRHAEEAMRLYLAFLGRSA